MTEATAPPAAGTTGSGGSGLRPARADGVTLIGEMQGSGYRTPPALARRADGQTLQLTPLLYATLSALDGRRSFADVASVVAEATGRPVSEDNARELVEKLRPLGLVVREDGSAPEVKRSNPLLGLRFKVAVTDEERTRRLTTPFAALFNPVLVLLVVAAFGWITWWVLFDKGLASATHEAFARPGLLLAVLAVTVLSAGFHEFGHAAAARRGGATPGVMGAGLYLVWPAFYTDVTDSYRLGRIGRLRTDLGGLYFNAIVAVVTVGTWWASRNDAILLLVATQILQMVRQLLPFVRFDGYHVLADLTGVPDLFQRIGPILRSLVPWRAADPEARALKPWTRAVVTAWVLTVVPLLLVVTLVMVLTLPRLVGTAWASARAQHQQMTSAFGEGDLIAVAARGLSIVVVVLPIAAFAYILVRLVRQVGGAVWRRTDGKPLQRGAAGLTTLALVAGLVLAWWPSPDRYQPIQAYETGTITGLLPASNAVTDLTVGSEGSGTVVWPDDADLPTREDPQLATVLVPTGSTSTTTTEIGEQPDPAPSESLPSSQADGGSSDGEEPLQDEAPVEQAPVETDPDTWIFPFDEPLAPDAGDTQALSINTTDNTVSYSVAFALVWADGSEPVDNVNEAHALASCTNCAAIAVAFQVVLVVGDADVAIPQNISLAVNYECTSCLTYSLAVQLFVTLDGPLSEDAITEVEQLWQQIMQYGTTIGQVPLSDIQAQLTAYEQQILDVIERDQGPLTQPTDSASPETSDNVTPSAPVDSTESTSTPTESPSPTESTSTSPPESTESPTESPTEPATTPTESPSPTETTSPTTSTPSPSPSEPSSTITSPTSPTSSPTGTP